MKKQVLALAIAAMLLVSALHRHGVLDRRLLTEPWDHVERAVDDLETGEHSGLGEV